LLLIPRTWHKKIQMRRIVLLQRLVDSERAVEIFLIPPAGYIQRRDSDRGRLARERLTHPEVVVVRMRYKIIPRRNLSVKILLIHVGKRADVQVPLVRVVAIELKLFAHL